ncbi:hypothetical protein [Saccharicrinis sp. GN24d3]|uniref:hypothetical protein n=1 Tax=Saccharicrinis sp. GN24d3 TaxID=3458416 RepID=UPI00403554CF
MGACQNLLDDLNSAKVDFVTDLGLRVADVSLYIDEVIKIDVEPMVQGMPKPVVELMPGEDGILKMRMTQKYNTLRLDSMINIADSVFADSTGFPAISNFYVEGDFDFGFQLNTFWGDGFDTKQLDSLKLDNGIFKLEFNTYDQFYSEFTISFPGITDEKGEVLKVEKFVPSREKNSIDLDLSNHKIQVLKRRNREYFLIHFDFYIESLEDYTDVDPKIKFQMEKVDLDYIYGAFGYDTIPNIGPQEISMPGSILQDQDISMDFKRPDIKLHTRNSFDLPFAYNIKKALMELDDGSIEEVTGIPDVIYIGTSNAEGVSDGAVSTITIDPSTNIDELLGKGAEWLDIEGFLITNPNNPTQKNYIRDEDSLDITLDIDLPFEARISEIVIRDTIVSKVFEPLEDLGFDALMTSIKTDISNNFPFVLNIQSYFYDRNNMLIDSLFDNPAEIRGSDNAGNPVKTTFYSSKNQEQIEKLYDTRKTITVATFKTANAEEEKIVVFRNEHKLDISLTILTSLHVQSGNEN